MATPFRTRPIARAFAGTRTMVMAPVPDDPYARLALVAHEAFHRVQESLDLSGSDQLTAHLDTENGRLWFRLVSATPPSAAALDRLVGGYGPQQSIGGLLRAVLAHGEVAEYVPTAPEIAPTEACTKARSRRAALRSASNANPASLIPKVVGSA